MWHSLNLLSSSLNQVSGLWGQKLWILNATWETVCCSSCSFFDAILYACITKECGLEVDCNQVQERAYAKAGSTLCRSTCFVLYSKRCTWDANNMVCAVAACKVECGVTNCRRDVHRLRARLLLYIRIGRLGRVYTISTHVLNMWYGHVTCRREIRREEWVRHNKLFFIPRIVESIFLIL